jgi:hypothetical protein
VNKERWGSYKCAHCGLSARGTQHLEGSHRGLQRCGSESGLAYGYNCHPESVPCRNDYTACIGRLPAPDDAGDRS